MKITIPGKPIAWKRAQTNNRRYYDSQLKLKETYRILFKMHTRQPLSGPLTLICCFFMPIPQSQRKKITEGHPHTYRGDLDNYCKLILDAGSGVLYHDDSQIAHLVATKCYGHTPKTLIELKPYNASS